MIPDSTFHFFDFKYWTSG